LPGTAIVAQGAIATKCTHAVTAHGWSVQAETDRQTDRDRKTERQKDRKTDRQTDGKTDRQTDR
jgi:hypothetical protein